MSPFRILRAATTWNEEVLRRKTVALSTLTRASTVCQAQREGLERRLVPSFLRDNANVVKREGDVRSSFLCLRPYRGQDPQDGSETSACRTLEAQRASQGIVNLRHVPAQVRLYAKPESKNDLPRRLHLCKEHVSHQQAERLDFYMVYNPFRDHSKLQCAYGQCYRTKHVTEAMLKPPGG
ncbi:hypothetical protein SVAN01_06341 [Stagonosporopsis vannaccii]|nr:hypothetical protein SVAN01_06341 [Stagonosporopsis vannaccii]